MESDNSEGNRDAKPNKPTMRYDCTECGWSADNHDGGSESNVQQFAIEHYVTTGHEVVSGSISDRERARVAGAPLISDVIKSKRRKQRN